MLPEKVYWVFCKFTSSMENLLCVRPLSLNVLQFFRQGAGERCT
jgi:hypothetical protein